MVNIATIKMALQRGGFLARERPVDDELDSETWTALYEFAESRGFDWSMESMEDEDGEIPPEVIHALLDPMAMLSFAAADADEPMVFDDPGMASREGPLDLSSVEVFDLTTQHDLNPAKAKRTPRPLSGITTILLHQTGVKFGVTKSAMAKYGPRVGLHRRFYDVACHVAALTNGDVLYVNPWERYVLHGNSANRFSIGIEIEGLYAGVVGDPKTVSGTNPMTLTPATIAAARRAVKYAVEEGRKLGCPITQIAAHRSFHGSRISDPGQEIWREVALWAVAQFDLRIDYDLAVKSKKEARLDGRRIPREWDPAGKINYRGKDL
jgi:hypothetical protein